MCDDRREKQLRWKDHQGRDQPRPGNGPICLSLTTLSIAATSASSFDIDLTFLEHIAVKSAVQLVPLLQCCIYGQR